MLWILSIIWTSISQLQNGRHSYEKKMVKDLKIFHKYVNIVWWIPLLSAQWQSNDAQLNVLPASKKHSLCTWCFSVSLLKIVDNLKVSWREDEELGNWFWAKESPSLDSLSQTQNYMEIEHQTEDKKRFF